MNHKQLNYIPINNTTTPQFIPLDKDKGWNKHIQLEDEKMVDQIEKDVHRSLNHYNIKLGKELLKRKLSGIMGSIFQQNEEWNYYQGYNDICSAPLMALNENLGYHVSLSISNYFIRDYLKSSFEKGVIPALKLMMKILEGTHRNVYDKISFIDIPTFAVSWIITWFSHDLDN